MLRAANIASCELLRVANVASCCDELRMLRYVVNDASCALRVVERCELRMLRVLRAASCEC